MTLLSFDELMTIADEHLTRAEKLVDEGRYKEAAEQHKKGFFVLGAIKLYTESGHNLFEDEQVAFDAATARFFRLMPILA